MDLNYRSIDEATPCTHDGPHLMSLNGYLGGDRSGRTIADYARIAVNHAVDTSDDDKAAAWAILDRADRFRPNGLPQIQVSDTEIALLVAVMEDACDYMTTNNYIDSPDGHKDDRAAANVFADSHRMYCDLWRRTV